MQEGQDRSGDQPPEYLGAWSPIPAEDQPDRPAGDEPAAAGSLAEQDEPAAPEGTWIVPASGDERSGAQGPDSAGSVPQEHGLQEQGLPEQGLQGQDRPGTDQPEHGLAGLGFGGQPDAAQPGYGQAAPPQGGYPQPGPGQPGYGQPGPNQ